MAQKRDSSGQEKSASTPTAMATSSKESDTDTSPRIVQALVLERASRDSDEATVLLETRPYLTQVGGPIQFVAQLMDAAVDRVKEFFTDFRLKGEPLVFRTEPRQGGQVTDRQNFPAKRLHSDMLDHYIAPREEIESAHCGPAGNPYFVIVTRAPPHRSGSASSMVRYGMYE